MKFENVTDKHRVLKAACIGIERNLDLAKDGDKGGLVEVVISLRQCGEYIAQQYLLHFGEKGRNDSLSEMLKRLEPLFQKDQKDEYGREFLKTLHRIKTEANSVIHSPEGRHVEVTMLTGLAENLDALLPQFYKDIPDKLKEQTEENMQCAENKNEAVASSDVSTRISQQLAELDEAYLHRAEKHIELLLAEKAAEAGDAEAQARCGDLYLNGNGEDILVSRRMAHHWYMEAAKQGHVRAQLLCGEYYYNRYYPIRDSARAALQKAEALQWYEKAAEQGNAQAQFCCGNMYYRGEGMDEPDFEKAFYWYEKAAEQGHPHAQYALGGMYGNYGTEDDDKKAFYWYLQSAQQGYDEAQVIVGSLYERGDGTDVDYQKALYWYEKAAEQGHDHGVVACASMYREGKGTPVDLEKARYWADRIARD